MVYMNASEAESSTAFDVTGMDCAACARTVERGVSTLPGVEAASINFTTGILQVRGAAGVDAIQERVAQLGYQAHPRDPAQLAATGTPAGEVPLHGGAVRSFLTYMLGRSSGRLTLLGLLLVLPGLLLDELLPLFGVALEWPLARGMALAALAVAGYPVARSAWNALRINRQITINLLMTIAAVGAVVIGAWTEAGLVMVLFALGEALEGYTAGRARASLRSLLEVAPNEALVLRPCIDCREHLGQEGYQGGPCPFCGIEEQRVPVEALRVGESIVVRPGDRIAMDGRVVEGRSEVNQAPITGESLPVEKGVDDEVFAGSINGAGALVVEVTRPAADTTIARIVRLVAEAQERRAPVESAVDRFAAWYTPAVVVVAALVALLPPLFWSAPFWGVQGWLYRALELLVVACPCALVISTPVTLVSAIARGARLGILVKGGAVLQVLAQVDAVAFDKTGTLTAGEPRVLDVRAVNCKGVESGVPCAPCDDLLALAYAVERRSEHALARAVTAHAEQRGVGGRYAAATGVLALPGLGVSGWVDGRPVVVGSHAWFDDTVPHSPVLCDQLDAAAQQGQTPLLLGVDDAFGGYILVADRVRDESRRAVDALRALGVDNLIMVTGDGAGAARHAAAQVGIDQVRAQILPSEKVAAVEALKVDATGRRRTVVMVGDGVNDAPALAAADVGVAMGAGTAQAMETADLVLLGDNLEQLPVAIRLARAAMRTIRANIVFSVGLKLVVFALVLAGLGSMSMAVFADVGASLLVTLNGMRLLRFEGGAQKRP